MILEASAEIDRITAMPRPLSSADLGRLAVLRHQLGARYVAEAPKRLPPEPSQDLFPGVRGVPEISGAELTGAHVASGLRQHGALVVRGLISPADVEMLISLIDGRDWSDPQQPCDDQGEVLPGSSPMKCSAASLQGLVEAYQNAGMREIMAEYLGEPAVLLSERLLLDRQTIHSGLPWHQDGAFFGTNVGGVNSFLALDSCGSEAMGLSVAAHRFDTLVGVEEGKRAELTYGASLKEDDVRELAGEDALITPILEAGDAIFIDEMTMHRTGRRPKSWLRSRSRAIAWLLRLRVKQHPRSWATTWFFAPSRFPDMRHPLWFG
jgi:phytanoyl-CoA dioxygenase PhyH